MAIRITPVGDAVLKVDGQLSGEEARLLVDACEAVAGPIILDLTDLQFADRQGVRMLRQLQARGATLTGLSPYLDLLLGGGSDAG